MDQEYFFLALGIASVCIVAALLISLIVSRKAASKYKRFLQNQKETFDVLSIIKQKELWSSAKTLVPDSGPTKRDMLDAPFSGKYEIIREINGGAMSSVYLVKNKTLENQWIMKFIDKRTVELTHEENILKMLNHEHLPLISDIYATDKGTYLIESYIEGISMSEFLKSKSAISHDTELKWLEQLAKVLSYLHGMDKPIIHRDLKPSNIMITPDKNLVLIDFGISKRVGDEEGIPAFTYRYAAPEQMKHGINETYRALVYDRFGDLPPDLKRWSIDQRTDIFSLGVIFHEVIVGDIPRANNEGDIYRHAIPEVADIIIKCTRIRPEYRYQSISELLEDIQKVKATEQRVLRSVGSRKAGVIAASFFTLLSGASFSASAYFFNIEKLSNIVLDPTNITISLQQKSEFAIEKFLPDGTEKLLDSDQIRWSIDDSNVVAISGNYVVGLNIGETSITGLYKNKAVKLDVKVIDSPEEMVDVSLRYRLGNVVQTFAGNGISGEADSDDYESASFVYPGSIAVNSEGTYFVAEPNCIRRISESQIETISFDKAFIAPDKVRCFGKDLYVLTKTWVNSDDGKEYFAIIKLNGNALETVYYHQAEETAIADFLVSQDYLYFLEQSFYQFSVNLKRLDLSSGEIELLDSFDEGISSMALYGDFLFMSNPIKGIIQSYNIPLKKLSFFAGIEDEKGFIDGTASRFYEPLKIAVQNDYLYVLDFNIFRRIEIIEGAPGITETIAGTVINDLNPLAVNGEGTEAVFIHSANSEFVISESKIVVTDPKSFILRYIDMSASQ
jgi:serine/threonine protein kinase